MKVTLSPGFRERCMDLITSWGFRHRVLPGTSRGGLGRSLVPTSQWGDQSQVVTNAELGLETLCPQPPTPGPPAPAATPRADSLPRKAYIATQGPKGKDGQGSWPRRSLDSPWGFWSPVPSVSKDGSAASLLSLLPDKGLILRLPEAPGEAGVAMFALAEPHFPCGLVLKPANLAG